MCIAYPSSWAIAGSLPLVGHDAKVISTLTAIQGDRVLWQCDGHRGTC